MRRLSTNSRGAAAFVAAVLLAGAPRADAQSQRVAVTGDAGIHVWVEQTGEVLDSYDDVIVSFRPVRDCYATVYAVDTNGSLHVVFPPEHGDRVWVRAGVTYRYSALELGLDEFGKNGIAHLFAVGSPRAAQSADARVVSSSRTVSDSMREYREKYRGKVERRAAELASARTTHSRTEVFAKQQRVTRQTEASSKGKPTSTRAAESKSGSDRKEEAKAGSASSKAR